AIETDLGYPTSPEHHVCTPVAWAPFASQGTLVTSSRSAVGVTGAAPSTPASDALSMREIAGISTAVAGVVVASFGLYYTFRARELATKIDSHDPSQPWSLDQFELQHDAETAQSRERYLLLAGGTVVAAGAALYLTGRAARLAEHVKVAPTASGGAM